jgi:hypothetical protein
MATLNEVMIQTAEAIREKTGKSELIAPVNFAEEIKSISAGGGESGGSNWRYFDATKATVTEDSLTPISMLFQIFKNNHGDNLITILPKVPPLEEWEAKIVAATATDFNLKICHPTLTGFERLKTIEEVFNDMGGIEALEQALGFTEITKEQFYDLNA